MKLYLTATSERGKPVNKSGNEAITIQLTKDRQQVFSIMFDGDKLEILNFAIGKVQTIEYIESHVHTWSTTYSPAENVKWCETCHATMDSDGGIIKG